MLGGNKAHQTRPFNLLRWFSLTALGSVLLVSILAAWVFSSFLTDRMIRQEAEITAGFVRNIVATENAYSYFDASHDGKVLQLQDFLDHLTRMPEVLRTNIYSADRRMLWSSDSSLIGQLFEHNDELEEALRSDLVIHSGIIDPANLPKTEHLHLGGSRNRFIESYVPIFDVHGRKVVGVVELYKVPNELFEAIKTGVMMIWLTSGVGGLFLYLALFWIVRRAHGIIETQSDTIQDSDSLALAGEIGAAVATRLRNPLATIRSSAELSLESALPPEAVECSHDIITEVDRMESWIRLLQTYAIPPDAILAAININTVLRESLNSFKRDFERQGIEVNQQLAENLPPVGADPALLTQLIGNLIANAMEALRSGGEITVRSGCDPNGLIFIEIRDNGRGINPADLSLIFKPFFTKKAKGLGLGLSLVRRVVERLGGSVAADIDVGKGTAIRIHLPAWK